MTIYYKTFGESQNPALLLLHSGGMTSEEWKSHADFFARRFFVITPDFPGHGESPMQGERLSIRVMAEEVLACLDELGIESSHVCGSSMGGAVALYLTVHHSERIKQLVLYRVSYHKDVERFRETQAIADPERWIKLGLERWLSRIHKAQGGPEAWKQVIGRVAGAMNPETSDHHYSVAQLEAIEVPVLIAAGDRDPLVPMTDLLQMYQAIPNCALYIMPDATHITGTNAWRREIFDREVERFLRRGLQSHRYP